MRIAIGDHPTLGFDQLHDFHGWRLAHVVDILLISDTQYQYTTALEGPACLVQAIHEFAQYVFRHGLVDLTRQFDEAGMQSVFASLPSQVEGIDRDTVPAQSRPWVVRSETERLGRRSINHFKDVDTHAISNDLHFVDQTDIDRAMNVLQQLGHLGGLGGTDRHDPVDGLFIQGNADFQTLRSVTTDHFRNGTSLEVRVARIFTLRRIDQVDVPANHEATLLHAWQQLFLGSSRIGGTFQRNHLPYAQIRF